MATYGRDEDVVPTCIHWSIEDVCNWMEELGLPQYRDCFKTNLINGRKLILVDGSHLPLLGVTDYDHIKYISKSVRELLMIEDPYWNRSISLLPRETMGMFLQRRSRTGASVDSLTYSQHLKGH